MTGPRGSELALEHPQDKSDVAFGSGQIEPARGYLTRNRGLAEDYRVGQIHLHVHLATRLVLELDNPEQWCAIVHRYVAMVLDPQASDGSHHGRRSERRSPTRGVYERVLIRVVECANGAQQNAVASVVRLHSLDECCVLGSHPSGVPAPEVRPFRSRVADREVGVFVGASADFRELPSEVFEGGSEVVKHVAGDDTDVQRDALVLNEGLGTHDDYSGLTLLIEDQAIRMSVDEGSNLNVQFFEMGPCAGKLCVGLV